MDILNKNKKQLSTFHSIIAWPSDTLVLYNVKYLNVYNYLQAINVTYNKYNDNIEHIDKTVTANYNKNRKFSMLVTR